MAKEFIIKKEEVLWKHPDIFAKLIWRNGIATVTAHRKMDEGHYRILADGDFIDVPAHLLHNI